MSELQRSAARASEAREAYLQLASAADGFEQYANPHAVRIAARMHDLGEVAMERDYIQRAGPLTAEERIDLERHPVIGEQEAARASADRDVQLLVRWHHEWWNGGGYPDALRQDEIPLAARILRVADSYAALTDARPHRPALTEQAARDEIIRRAGIEFDPSVVAALLALEDFNELRSFAKSAAEVSSTTTADDDGWLLFSSFMK